MNEPFLLEVSYQNKTLEFPAAFQRYGYTYRIVVTVNEVNYIFEPDEEGSYRVIGDLVEKTDLGLLRAIAVKLQMLV
ncbi:MAG TPA: hypothetical protein VJ844_04135 [Mucilaginibacter sp.]|nr:hypothetical protein [Mucilaginibacter sp.]